MADTRNKKILLVEDHQFILNVIYDLLKSAGFKNISKCTSAEAALDIISADRYDMIITDVEMGEMNGMELLKLIRSGKTKQPTDTRVIMLTSHASTQVLGTAIALDANGFLVKPAKLNATVDKINDAFAEDFKPRRPIGYYVIPTEVLDKPDEEAEEKEHKEPADDLSKGFVIGGKSDMEGKKTIEKAVTDLHAGMVISENIVNDKGVVLVQSGQELTQGNVEKIILSKDQLKSEYVSIYE